MMALGLIETRGMLPAIEGADAMLKAAEVRLLEKNLAAIFASIAAGVLTSLGSVLAMAWLLKLERAHAVSFLPKSVTTAIGMDVAETLGGTAALAGAVIILTGIVGSLLGETVCNICPMPAFCWIQT